MMTILQTRAKVAAEIRDLADKGKTGPWSDADETSWRELNATFDNLTSQFEREQRGEHITKSLSKPLDQYNPGREDHRGSNDIDPTAGNNANAFDEWFRSDSGLLVPVVKRDQKFADAVRCMRPERFAPEEEAYRGLTAGAFVRAMVTGPRSDVERRALSEGTDSAGGYAVNDFLSAQVIDLMRARSRTFQAGATSIPLNSDQHHFAKLSADPTPAWRAENAAVAESDPTFARVSFAPFSLAVLTKASRELLEDSVNAEAAVMRAISGAMANELDRAALFGAGTTEPLGLFNVSGIGEVDMGTNGSAIVDYDPLLDALEDVQTANGEGLTAAIMHPRTWRAFEGRKDGDSQQLRRPTSLEDLAFLHTTQVPITDTQGTASDASSILTGHFEDLVVGIRSRLRIEVLKERYADTMAVGFLAHMRADVQVWHAGSFSKIVGIIP